MSDGRRPTAAAAAAFNMPSICNGSSSAAAVIASAQGETDAPCSKLLTTYLEKRTRNLDKRKAKLDGYLQKESAGEKLDRDQKEALKQLPVVVGMIECLKETTDHVIKTITEEEKRLEKQQRKLAKRQLTDSHKQIVSLFVQLMQLQRLLAFLNDKALTESLKNGSCGSLVLTDDELSKLNLLKQMVSPPAKEKTDIVDAELTVNYLQGKDGSYCGCDFKVFREILKRVEDSESLIRGSSKTEEKFEEKNIQETTVAKTEVEAKEIVAETAKPVTHELSAISQKPTSLCKPSFAEEVVQNVVHITKPNSHSCSDRPLPTVSDAPARAMKAPQEILSAVRGSYNFLQDSEIEESENTENIEGCGFSPYGSFVPLPSGYSVAQAHGVHPDPHQLLVQQPVPFSGHLLTLSYPQNLVNESIYMAHGLPAGYTNGMAMTTPYTMHDAYSQPIVSHELNSMMVPTTVYYDMSNPMVVGAHEVDEATAFEALDVVQPESNETEDLHHETADVQQQQEDDGNYEAAASEPEKKKFSMNPNADVFRSKNYPDAEGEFSAHENGQGGFGGRRNGRGGRIRGSHQGYQARGGYRGYGGRGGGYSRYPRNDYRQEGYTGDYNGWHNAPRRDRGGRGGNPRGGAGRGGRGGYERAVPQNEVEEEEAQE